MIMKRSAGVLMHISSLWGDYGCGSFGREAGEFIDFLADAGFSYWQVLPFGMVDECNSPYKSYSAFAGNPYFVDLPSLKDEGLLTDEELSSAKQTTPYSCEFVRLYHTRCDLLAKAAKRVSDRTKIEEFIKAHPHLEAFSRFMALKKSNSEKMWRDFDSDAMDENVIFMWHFIQYKFFTQWSVIKRYANDRGIKIIGDIPIYVAYDSADVWANKDQFLLDEDGRPSLVAGVPPDYFSASGQKWGNPLYDWEKMKSDSFGWWRERISHMLSMFDGIRIDHFRGLESYYAIPEKDPDARNGKWMKGPGREFIDVIKECAKDKLIIAEDLGDVTKEVTDLVSYSGFPGMRVLQFGFISEDDNPHLPHNYENNSVAYTGTHDNNTLLGFVWELDDNLRKRLMRYSGYDSENWDRGYDSIIRTMYESHAGLVILPIQDLLGYGSDTRLNIPGKADGNWQYRVTKDQLCSIDKGKYKSWLELYKRVK